jgi:sugar phosphate isomerase/epimerase
VPAFQALAEIGFTGYMAYECGISGEDKSATLQKSLAYLRDCIAQARAA